MKKTIYLKDPVKKPLKKIPDRRLFVAKMLFSERDFTVRYIDWFFSSNEVDVKGLDVSEMARGALKSLIANGDIIPSAGPGSKYFYTNSKELNK